MYSNYLKGECMLKRNQLLDIISKRPKAYIITFDIKPLSIIPTWSSILHFSVGGNRGNFGDRAPGVWFKKNSTLLYICSDFYTAPNKCSTAREPLPLDEFSHVEIKQCDLGKNIFLH